MTRTLLIAALALGLAACANDATPTATSDDNVSTAGDYTELPAMPAGTYTIDAAHSRAEFRVRHLGISTVTGRFGDVAGTVTVGDNTIETNATIDASTISTGNGDRDGHLQSPDFFDVAQYPEITFTSTGVRAGEGNTFTLLGDLTMHGVTHPVELQAEYLGSASMMGTPKVGFTASGEIKRQDWGLTWAETNEAGEALVGDDVTLMIEIEANGEAPAAPADSTAAE